jgi:UDP-GlcNAc:undecaprenyl-phosphate GlcNAc-1-phosphate transferase
MVGDFPMMAALMAFGVVITFISVPILKEFALKHSVVSRPGGRRTHNEPVPLLGGVAIFLPVGLVFLGLIGLWLSGTLRFERPDLIQMVTLFLGVTFILVLGTVDDVTPVRWWKKLLGQVSAAGILAIGGHSINVATLPFFGVTDFGWTGIPLFMIAVVAVTNAINLVDGIDGLAGGICFFAALTSGILGLAKGDLFAATIGFTVSGSLLGFLFYNFPPASIFMGDGGSMMIGFLLGALATSSAAVSPGQRLGTSAMILIPFLPFGIPLFEVILSVVRRWLRGQAIFLGDGDHLHYRVTGVIKNPRLTVGIFYLFTTLLCALTLFLVLRLNSDLVRLLMVVMALVVFAGLIASIRLYRVESLFITLRNRPHFTFLGSYLWFMKHKVIRAGSLGELIALLESGVTDLSLDCVEVRYDEHVLRRWNCADPVHPGNERISEEVQFDGGRLVVKWQRPEHEDQAYNEYLRLTWHRFLNMIGPAMEDRVGELSGREESKPYGVCEKVSS